ncbi:MAG: serine hydrolase [Bacteroidota bacterium]
MRNHIPFISSSICLTFFVSTLSAQPAKELEGALQNLTSGYGGVIGAAAKDMRTGRTVLVNADSLFPTASVIKLPILVELFHQAHEGKLSLDREIKLEDSVKVSGSGVLQFLKAGETLQLIDVATLMIILSDNTATNLVIDQLGQTHDEKLDAVNNRMHALGLGHTRLLNKLYSWKTKKKTAEALRFGIGVSTPLDMIILLEKLAKGEMFRP